MHNASWALKRVEKRGMSYDKSLLTPVSSISTYGKVLGSANKSKRKPVCYKILCYVYVYGAPVTHMQTPCD